MTPVETDNEISISLPNEIWNLVYDMLKVRQYSLERDIARADDSGSMDYAQVLLDDAAKCKEASDEISFHLSLSSFTTLSEVL